MGLFSDKVKTIRGISFTPVVQDTREEYSQFRKELLAAMINNFTIKKFAYELWKYKKSVRHRYNTSRLDEISGGIQTKTFIKSDYTIAETYMQDNGVTDIVRVLSVEDRVRINVDDTEDYPDSAARYDIFMEVWFTNQTSYSSYDVSVPNGYDTHMPYQDAVSFGFTDTGIANPVILTVNYEERETIHHYDTSSGSDVHIGSSDRLISNGHSVEYEATEYFYGRATYLSTGSDHSALPISTEYLPLAVFNQVGTTTTSFNIAPMLQVKGLNSVATEQDEEIMKQLKSFGIGITSIQSLLDNSTVKDFKVGLMVSPHDALTSKPITKYLFNFFDSLGIPTSNEYSDVFLEGKDGFSFVQPVGSSTYTTEFSVSKSIKSGTIPSNNQKTYKLKCKQNIPNHQRFYRHIKEVYESVLSGNDPSNSKTTKQLYDEIVDALNSSPNDQSLIDAREELPSYRATTTFQPIKYVIVSCEVGDYITASETERSEAITYTGDTEADDENKTIIFDVIGANEIQDFQGAEKYSATISQGYEYNSLYADYLENGNQEGKPETVFAIDFNYQHSPTEYTVISYSNAKITYITDSGTVTQRHTATDTDLRLPMHREALQGITIYEFHELYSKCFTGLAFTVQRIRIKWYQRGIFKTILQIVLVVIAVAVTVLSGGAGSGIGAALVSVATNIAISYAVTAVVAYVLDEVGVDSSWVGVVVAVLQVALIGTLTGDAIAQLGLALADTAVKLELQSTQEDMERLQEQQKEFQSMMDKKVKELKKKLETYSGDIFNLVKESPEYADMILYSPSYAVVIEDGLAELQEREAWKLPEVSAVSFNQSDTLGSNWNTLESQFTPNLRIGEIHTFGVSLD